MKGIQWLEIEIDLEGEPSSVRMQITSLRKGKSN